MKKVSVIMPVLNEERTIAQCINALLNLDYPKDKIEIVIAYGKSKDMTTEILKRYAKRHSNIKLYKNPTSNTAWGRNICLMHSTGEYIMNYSGHVIAEPNLLKVLTTRLDKVTKDIVAVGCSNVSAKTKSIVGTISGYVFESIVGGKGLFVQNESYDNVRYVDHVSFALYKRDAVEEVGRFDTHFWCGQDAELDLRLLKKGYNILYTPETKVYHYKRDTIISLFKQMYRYGSARAKMGRKHKNSLKAQHYAGLIFLLMIMFSPFFAYYTTLLILPLMASLYYIISAIFVYLSSKSLYALLAPFISFIIHFAYGLGFLGGIMYGKIIMR